MHEPKSFLRKYIFSTDHKVIGIQYLFTAIFMALVASALAILMRIQLAWPETTIILPETYLSLVTLHGTIMIFFVISLALIGAFGNFLIPLLIGARDMAYPVLNMLSYWVIVPASLLILISFLVEGGAAASGWTAYPPLSAIENAVPGSGLGQTLWLLAMALFIVSFTMGGLNYLTTILNSRVRGMSMMRLPLLIWTFLIATILGLLAFPALTAAAILLLMDRLAGTSFYLPEGMIVAGQVLQHSGGTPLLFQHLFWFLGHPEVYVLGLPAIGIAFEVLPVYSRRPPFGYRLSVYSILLIAFLSMIVWGHHMFTSGMNPYIGKYFSIVTVLITVPFAVLGLNLIASLWRSRIRLETPMLFALALISAIGTGGLGGIYLGTSTSDIYFHDSYFVVGHFHLMIGTVTFFGIFAGIYHWFPKMFGRFMNDRLGRIHFWFTAIPMFTIFILMHFQGMSGMLRRMYDNSVHTFNDSALMFRVPITVVTFILTAAQLLFLFNFFASMKFGKKAEQNPWQATTLDWTTESPPPHGNWREELPEVHRWAYEYGENGGTADFVPQHCDKTDTPSTGVAS